MATRTTNYNLAKPEMTDLVTPAQFNENFDIIDAQLKSVSNTATAAMPKSGGTFTGNAKAYETARTTRGIFNEETRGPGTESNPIGGSLKSVKYFVNVT